MKVIRFALLLSFCCEVLGQDPCEPLNPYDPIYQEVVERTGSPEGIPPDHVLYCGPENLHWEARWNDFQWGGNWEKTILGRCDGRFQEDTPKIFTCHRSLIVSSELFEEQITLSHDIDILRIKELVSATRTRIAAQDRVTRIDYTPVKDGGSWSAAQHGYQVTTSDHPLHQSGRVLQLKLQCEDAECAWIETGNRVWTK